LRRLVVEAEEPPNRNVHVADVMHDLDRLSAGFVGLPHGMPGPPAAAGDPDRLSVLLRL
jgi:hypothetical protein